MSGLPCPYLKGNVELTEERERHIAERHPDLLPGYRKQMIETPARPSPEKCAIWERQIVLSIVY